MRTEEQIKHCEELVAALRSGKFKQIRQKLHTKDGYCCLGVACEIAGERWIEGEDSFMAQNIQNATMPENVMDYYGFRDNCGVYGSRGDSLAGLNDGGAPFDEIADVVEAAPPGLFV